MVDGRVAGRGWNVVAWGKSLAKEQTVKAIEKGT